MSDADRERDEPADLSKADEGVGSAQQAAPAAAASLGKTHPVDIQTYIGQQLRAVYEGVANQPVPDRFLELMRQLDAK